MRSLTPVVKNLLILNILLYAVTLLLGRLKGIDLTDILGLHYWGASKFQPFQFITYMFMHDTRSFMHIFSNMFALFIFGSAIEATWGSKRFIFYYLVCGIGAALLHYAIFYYQISHDSALQLMNQFTKAPNVEILNAFMNSTSFMDFIHSNPDLSQLYQQFVSNWNTLLQNPSDTQAMQQAVTFVSACKEHYLNLPVVIGASGAIFGILLAFGMLFPNAVIQIYFVIPMKAKWFVILYGLFEFFSGIYSNDNVAHFAHLGGMLFGLILILYWRKKGRLHSNSYERHYE